MSKIRSLDELAPVKAYLDQYGAEMRSLRRAVVVEKSGDYWRDLVSIKFDDKGNIEAPVELLPDRKLAKAIKKAIKNADLPKSIPAISLRGLKAKGKLYPHMSPDGKKILMVVERCKNDNPKYLTHTYFDDGVWRCTTPDGDLPLYGLETLKDHTTAFIHEGAKAAYAARNIPEDHPWALELSGAAHVGWHGGALNPGKTDWSALREAGIKFVYIVPDNDDVSREAVPEISRLTGLPAIVVQFDDQFPWSFDLADEFPDPKIRFRELLVPGTWLTRMVKVKAQREDGRGGGTLRGELTEAAKGEWLLVRETGQYVHRHFPALRYRGDALNSAVASLCHRKAQPRNVIDQNQTRTIYALSYRPDQPGDQFVGSTLNTYRPPDIKPVKKSADRWLRFLEGMIPVEKDRREFERWCATLIARPGNRMMYGVIMFGKPGIGKSFIASHVLAPLVGQHNVSEPDESSITGGYQDWLAEKRLIIIHELHGSDPKALERALKSVVTEPRMRINIKYVPAYEIDNYASVYAATNHPKPIFMTDDDRRWLVPELEDRGWSVHEYGKFFRWLRKDGLGRIQDWAENYGDFVAEGEHSPLTDAKAKMFSSSI